MFLTDEQLSDLTRVRGRKKLLRYERQRVILVELGIEHKVRPDGSLLVLTAHVERLLGGSGRDTVSIPQEPDWDGLEAATAGRGAVPQMRVSR